MFIKKKTQYAPDSHPFMWSFSRTSVLNIIHMTYYHFTTENMGSCVFVSHDFFFSMILLAERMSALKHVSLLSAGFIHPLFLFQHLVSKKIQHRPFANESPVSEI